MNEQEAPETPNTPEQIKQDIEDTRAELAASVEELTARMNVKKRAADKSNELQEAVRPYQTQIIAAAGSVVLLAVVIVLRRRRSSS